MFLKMTVGFDIQQENCPTFLILKKGNIDHCISTFLESMHVSFNEKIMGQKTSWKYAKGRKKGKKNKY